LLLFEYRWNAERSIEDVLQKLAVSLILRHPHVAVHSFQIVTSKNHQGGFTSGFHFNINLVARHFTDKAGEDGEVFSCS